MEGQATRQGYHDRQLAALMLLEGIPFILTENVKAFSAIQGITPVNPHA